MSNNSSHNEAFEERCAAYVLDTLEPGERQAFESQLEDASQDELETYRSFKVTANHLAFTVDRAEPPATVLEQIMSQIGDDASVGAQPPVDSSKTKEKKQRRFSRSTMAIAAALALLLITLALAFLSFDQYSTINDQETTITELQTELQQKEEMLSILEARTVDLVAMDGLEVNPNGYGKIIWDSEKQQALLQVSNLPKVPEDKAYQLWLIRNNKPVPSATFTVGGQGGEGDFFKIERLAQADKQSANAFAITLEPKGGSQQPTGDMYMLGNVGQQNN